MPSQNTARAPPAAVIRWRFGIIGESACCLLCRRRHKRHTFATRAVAAGVDLPTLSAILGHTSIQMTMRYVHPAEEQKRFAAGKLETFRLAGMVEAMEKSRQATTISATVQ
jgi:hypothetical protein